MAATTTLVVIFSCAVADDGGGGRVGIMGKTRIIAATIREMRAKYPNLHTTWLSTSQRLSTPAQLEMDAVGGGVFNKDIEFKSYASARQMNPLARGVTTLLILDEAHMCRRSSSLTAQAVNRMLDRSTFVLYVTATCASSVKQLQYLHRLGLWQDNAAFRALCQAANPEVLEIISVQLKQEGKACARQIGFHNIPMRFVTTLLNPGERLLYDRIVACVTRAGTVVGSGGRGLVRQTLFQRLISRFKTRHTIDVVQSALDEPRVHA